MTLFRDTRLSAIRGFGLAAHDAYDNNVSIHLPSVQLSYTRSSVVKYWQLAALHIYMLFAGAVRCDAL